MIRWNYLLPRLMIALVAVICIRLAANPTCQAIATKSLQAVTGATVQIENTEIGFYPPIVEMTRLQIADPRRDKMYQNLIEIDELKLELDIDQLLRKSLVVNRAIAEGIHIHSTRKESGHLPTSTDESNHIANSRNGFAESLTLKTQSIQTQFDEAIQDLSCTRTVDEIKTRWQNEFAVIQADIQTLEREAKDLLLSTEATTNPLRNIEQIQSKLSTIKQYRESLEALQKKFVAIPEQIQQDQIKLVDSKERDLNRLKEHLPLPLTDKEALNRDLIENTVIRLLDDVKTYLEYGETIAHYTFASPESERSRGQIFPMHPATSQSPYVRECLISGNLRHRGENHQLTAKIENLAKNKKHMTLPCRVQMTLQGRNQLMIEYAIQKKGNRELSQLTTHWPSGRTGEFNFGLSNAAGIQWDASDQEIWIQLKKDANKTDATKYSGRLINIQRNTKLSLTKQVEHNAPALLTSLTDQLSLIREIQMDVSFSNKNGQWSLDATSNLTPHLADFSDRYITRQFDLAKEKSRQQISRAYESQKAELNTWLAHQQINLRAQFDSTTQMLERIKDQMVHHSTTADAYLSRLRSENPN